MKKTHTPIIFLFCILSIHAQQQLNIIPAVQEWHYSDEKIPFNNININWPKETTSKKVVLLERFKNELQSIGVKIGSLNDSNTLSLFFDTNYKELKEGVTDAYKIQLDKRSTIEISSYNALVHATRTILQLCSQNQYKNYFPKGIIKDYPIYQKRMLLLDVARKFFSVDEIKDFIRILAWVKMNELHLHLSDNSWGGYSAYRLESKLYPELTAKDGYYTWKEIRKLQDFATSYGITITPEIDAPGHSLAFTDIRPDLKSKWLSPNYLDITNPNTYVFMEEILNEVIPHFDAPDFHLGTDEYRINSIEDDSLKYEIGNTFKKYINHFNKVVKNNGKTTRIWSGFEHMPGKTPIDKDIIIDMWETSDAQDKSNRGYKFINSSHYYTYIVPGAPYYGVNNKFIYEKWTPEIFSDKKEQNLLKGSSGLLGSKMHIWNDFGPLGYTTSEIARLSIPSILTFSEKMWGTKGYSSFLDFQEKMQQLLMIPNTKILNRYFAKEKTIFYNVKPINLNKEKIKEIKAELKNIEYPWSLEMTLKKMQEVKQNELLLSSKEAAIYSQLEYEIKKKENSEIKKGFAIIRANQTEGVTPLKSHNPQVIIFDYILPLNQEVYVKLIGEEEKTSLYVDGVLIGSENVQMLCPLEFIGSLNEKVFQGTIKNISAKRNSENRK
ncbi:glycoside hydrolase family 20 protein [Tamlana sp. 2201CG12-4]|uniref:beta-N-acetylhexosaminidase n=1 Tax=Tamlana sp. 2201CG12-4 TaxID=3112582 RepID=UPI002DBCC82C|nr:glycoside hydrolase family 20 protein [Tamlana sp. 2201CG12-4]MEC3908873.1 glycoside hydrolase family 20 protein [Tamlana sp. 2201CG12-4]